jgi:hypothetical protein
MLMLYENEGTRITMKEARYILSGCMIRMRKKVIYD